MDNENVKSILDGCRVLKDRHFYKEVVEELLFLRKQKKEDFQKLNKVNQQAAIRILAECTYQDKELSAKVRFRKALAFLEELDILDGPEDRAETCCLRGAVFKRKYQLNKSIYDLHKAIKYYKKAADDIQNDNGYGAVNAIFLYKTLIKEHSDILDSIQIKHYEFIINEIRTNALTHLIEVYPNSYKKPIWIDRTISELYFSDEQYEEAKKYLKRPDANEDIKKLQDISNSTFINDNIRKIIQRAIKIKISESRDTLITIEQLIRLYKVQKEKISENEILFLEDFFEDFIEKRKVKNIIHNVLVGKLGLALSGGGFRASLFHLGVFARLAELDMLKHIDVISSVSGGSIIAMHYYLKLQALLETKENYTIQQSDYIQLVKEMEQEFLDGIQTNIRMQAFEKYNPSKETITQQIGKLYQKELFDKAVEDLVPKKMKELYIFPKIDGKQVDNFNPHFNNFEIENKVPILVINSTCLNNGHNWRFTASGMGESQYMYDTTIDKNKVHKYTRYSEFKNEFKNFTIADAVASSSCVPGLFDPIELNGAYAKGENIKLVDGGVYDNQGLASLLDEECNLIICSDASGQFNDDDAPSSCRLSVIPRVNDSLMDRGRDQAYELIKELLNDKKIDGLCILHLKQCFEIKECTPKSCTPKVSTDIECVTGDIYKDYDVEIQDALSKIRTDLDSFNDIEAYSLMYSGYTIMSKWFEAIKQTQPVWNNFKTTALEDWSFLKIKQTMDDDKERVLEQLQESQKLFFKYNPFKTSKICLVCLVIVGIALLYLICNNIQVIVALVILGIGTYTVKPNYLYKVLKYATKPILWIVAIFNLKCLNEKYLEKGKL